MIKNRAVRAVVVLLVVVLLPVGTLCIYSLVQTPERAAVQPATDHIVVYKSAHRMTLRKNGRSIRTYRVALGRGGLGNKVMAGDSKVPEGRYLITGRNPDSAYHLSLRIGYPTRDQAETARRRGVDSGGDIMIHGIRNGFGWIGGRHRQFDWTRGCIAVTDDEIEEIWRLVSNGTPIDITA